MKLHKLPKVKLYAVTRYPEDDEMPGYRISSCHQDFIKKMILKYQISSEYPQPYLCKIGKSISSKLVDMDGIPTHIYIEYHPEKDGYHFFSYPDTPPCIAWFTEIFSFMADMGHKYFFEKGIKLTDNKIIEPF